MVYIQRNMGEFDRSWRSFVAIILGLFYLSGQYPKLYMDYVYWYAFYIFMTGLLGYSPLYSLFKMRTNQYREF